MIYLDIKLLKLGGRCCIEEIDILNIIVKFFIKIDSFVECEKV